MKQFMENSGVLENLVAHPVASFGDRCGECPVWDPDLLTLFWTDCVGLKFCRYHPASGMAEVLCREIEIYGFRKHIGGGWVYTNPSGVWQWDGKCHTVLLCGEVDGQPACFNDCCADGRGRLIAGTFYYAPGTDYRLGGLAMLDLDGSARMLDDGFHLSNGIGFSPDGKTLYATDTVVRRIYAYDYDETSGTTSGKRVFVELGSDDGIPDGLAVDAAGNLWSAIWYGGCVHCYRPDGSLRGKVAVDAKQVSSVCFGGPELSDLYVTTAAQSEEMPVMPPGYDPTVGPFGGSLFVIRTQVRGLPQRTAAIPRKGASRDV
ncbi:MAG: SMP-30/gluconolactonase/LRE family protein [Bryobacterales bacterium]|nr:SMP-30/gluconolactonase/LRE family protein [Bryobacterales bacterium]